MRYLIGLLGGLCAICLTLAGCKIQIDVPEGGRVISMSGAYACESGQECLIDVYDLYFEEQFIAVPGNGYEFQGWRKRDKGLCAGETGACKVASARAENNEVLTRILESDEVFFLEPVFDSSSEADLRIKLVGYGHEFTYCKRKGFVDYEVDVSNFGVKTARDVVVTLSEEEFAVSEGWEKKRACKKQPGAISCQIGDLAAPSSKQDGPSTRTLLFSSKVFRNEIKRRHRVKFTVSSSSPDNNIRNDVYYWERTIPRFPEGKFGCDDAWPHSGYFGS